mgnify:CR=1 FL=1|jgi:hypothetical protein
MVSKTDNKRNKTRKTLIKYTNKLIRVLYFAKFFLIATELLLDRLVKLKIESIKLLANCPTGKLANCHVVFIVY